MIPIKIKPNKLTTTKMLTTTYTRVFVSVACIVTLPVKCSGVVVVSIVSVVAASVVVAVITASVVVAVAILAVGVGGVNAVVFVVSKVVFVVVSSVDAAAGVILVVASVNSGGTCQKQTINFGSCINV